MRILALDIETSPILMYGWGIWNETHGINQILNSTEIICVGAKFLGEKGMYFYSVYHDGKERMLSGIHALLSEADVVVHYNGQSFDIPHLNREFLQYGFKPPAPYKQVDLYRVIKKQFKFVSNKLEFVADEINLIGKARHEGFPLWASCLENDAAAWKRMQKYNEQDVRVVEALYERLLPWIPSLPSKRLYDGETGCPACGGQELQKRGFAYTTVSKFQRFWCKACGTWFRSSKRIEGVSIQQVVT